MANIHLQASLLSRFDCLFIMLDTIDVDTDRKIADHVVRMHRYRKPEEQDGQVLSIAADADVLTTKDLSDHANDDEGETPIYEKYDALLHGNSRKKSDKIVSVQFMKKYIHIAKCIKPVLTDAACSMLADEYANLRCNDFESGIARTQTVTARALETLIRLSTAHAKARLSKQGEEEDAEMAIELVQFAYFKKVLGKKSKKRGVEESEEEEEEDEVMPSRRDTPRKRWRLPARGAGETRLPGRSPQSSSPSLCPLQWLSLRTATTASWSSSTRASLRSSRRRSWTSLSSGNSLARKRKRSHFPTTRLTHVWRECLRKTKL